MLSSGRAFESCIELCRQHGFGRIEVASRSMAASARLSAGDSEGALQAGLSAIEAASRVGHRRAEVVARHIVFFCRSERGELAEARPVVEPAITLARQLGARRSRPRGSRCWPWSRRAPGAGRWPLDLLREALAISRETGMAYWGPILLGWLARHTDDADERRAALAEGEALLRAGGVSVTTISCSTRRRSRRR